MNCQEVVELMHRCLDRDLADQEYETMMEHMRHCPSCSILFERLQVLSGELERLPKVVPQYSLVDAILPKLREIDRVQAVSDEREAQADADSGNSTVIIPRRNRYRDKISWKIISGVIAAGFIFGLFVFNQQPPLKQADQAAPNYRGEESASAASSDRNMVRATSGKAKNSETSVADNMSATTNSAEKYDLGAKTENLAPASSPPADQELMAPKAAAPAAGDSAAQVNEASMQKVAVADQWGSLVEPLATADSPDGTQIAKVLRTEAGIRVVISDRQNAEIYASAEYAADSAVNLQWSKDGTKLDFDLTGKTAAHVTVDVAAKTESMEEK